MCQEVTRAVLTDEALYGNGKWVSSPGPCDIFSLLLGHSLPLRWIKTKWWEGMVWRVSQDNCSGQRKQQVQGPWGWSLLGIFKKPPGDQFMWARTLGKEEAGEVKKRTPKFYWCRLCGGAGYILVDQAVLFPNLCSKLQGEFHQKQRNLWAVVNVWCKFPYEPLYLFSKCNVSCIMSASVIQWKTAVLVVTRCALSDPALVCVICMNHLTSLDISYYVLLCWRENS